MSDPTSTPNPDQFLSVAGRWRRGAELSGMTKMPRPAQGLAMLAFYSGFAAALDAAQEVAAFDEETACQLLTALLEECRKVGDAATRAALGGSLN